ncbi:MAG: hypothetical protein H6862_02970 [Rhodospirillales bacterium]|nr:hypothetical protein [Rhodospirillales bacterium]
MTHDVPAPGYSRGCDYPHVDFSAFETGAFVQIERGDILSGDLARRTIVTPALSGISIPGAKMVLPGYDVALGDSACAPLKNRTAIVAYGSNCAPAVLLEKFRKASIGGDFFIAQANLPRHAVVHTAYVGAQGLIPATVMPHADSDSCITVGFFDLLQAVALTGTEPNYDLVQTGFPIALRGMSESPVLERGGLIYVSLWGALTMDRQNPIALSAIPSKTTLRKMPSADVLREVAGILGQENDVAGFYDSLPGMMPEDRLKHTFALQASNALPARFEGAQVKPATISAACIGRQTPQIQMLAPA